MMYLLFAWSCHCSGGGWTDFHSSHKTLEEAVEAADKISVIYEDWHIVHLQTMQVIKEN